MKTNTYFEIYRNAEARKTRLEAMRPRGHWGIAVGDDELALKWQAVDRHARKAELRLLCRLDTAKIADVMEMYLCRRCYYQESACTCPGEFTPIKYFNAFEGREREVLRRAMYTLMDESELEWGPRKEMVRQIAEVLGEIAEYENWLEGPLPF